jgi:hypothetical protein
LENPLTVVLFSADGSIIGVQMLEASNEETGKREMLKLLNATPAAVGVELWSGTRRVAAEGTDLLHIPRSVKH